MGQINYTSAQLNAMMVVMSGDGDSNVRTTTGSLQIINVTDGKFHSPWIVTSNGKPKQKLQTTGDA